MLVRPLAVFRVFEFFFRGLERSGVCGFRFVRGAARAGISIGIAISTRSQVVVSFGLVLFSGRSEGVNFTD